uniref:Metallo-beta-lactamase domain-containing protein n=1 Tax=Kalanchoe fedtschenkoi TaxID=63787 RepID=A0A7N0UND8_KALFE
MENHNEASTPISLENHQLKAQPFNFNYMAVRSSFNSIQLPFSFCQSNIKTSSSFQSTLYTPSGSSTPGSSHSDLKLSAHRSKARVCAVVSEESSAVVSGAAAGADMFKLTYLEGNSWLWDVNGLKLLVDPILVGNLDFGIPWLYDAAKRILKNFSLSDLPYQIDCLLITQSLDDHCHLKTLRLLSQKYPNLRVIATPNAKALLDPLFSNVIYLEPGQSHEINVAENSSVVIRATAGPVLGPPWQRPESGYIVTSPRDKLSLYYEPHCVYDQTSVEKEQADIVITPVIKQLLPGLTLVSGQEEAVKLAKLLNAKFVVPMKNGDLDARGILSRLIRSQGTVESFKAIMSKELPQVQVLEPTPGEPLDVPPPENLS